MSIAQSLIPEFDVESANTRRVLQHVSGDILDWKAHESLHTIRWVASHLVDIPGWLEITLRHDSFDVHPPGGQPHQSPLLDSVDEMLSTFDRNIATGREIISETSDEGFMQPWSLMMGGETKFSFPRIGVYRSFIMNHSIHHRGHLCVYLRMNGVEFPGLYDG